MASSWVEKNGPEIGQMMQPYALKFPVQFQLRKTRLSIFVIVEESLQPLKYFVNLDFC